MARKEVCVNNKNLVLSNELIKVELPPCVNKVDRPTQVRNTWFGFLAFVIILLLRVCL